MALEEVSRIRDHIKEITSQNKIDSNIDLLLEDLESLDKLEITKNILVSTKIVLVISPLKTKCKSKEVLDMINQLMNKWNSNNNAKAAPAPVRTNSNQVSDEKRRVNRKLFADELMKGTQYLDNPNSAKRISEQLAYEIENAIPKDDYVQQCRRLISALRDPIKNAEKHLLERIMSRDLPPAEFARFTVEDLMTEEQKAQKEKEKEEAFKAKQVPQPKACVSSLFRCRKCGSKNVTFYQQQTRSADEPMTNFCNCLDCGKQWRE